MFIAEKYPHQFPFPSKKTKTPLSPSASLLRSFELAHAARLRQLSLLASSSRPNSLGFLSAALSAVSDTITAASPLFLSLSSDPSAAIDSSASILSASNLLSASLDPFLRHRLLLLFSLSRRNLRDLPGFPNLDAKSASDLARSLVSSSPSPPSPNSSPIHSAVFAISALSAIVLPFVLAALAGSGGKVELPAPPPEHFPWAGEFNRLASLISEMSGRPVVEIKNLERAVETLKKVLEGADVDQGSIFKMYSGAEVGKVLEGDDVEFLFRATEKLTEEMTAGMEELSKTMYDLFRAALGLRNTALQCFRVFSAGN